jgi:hypothetical protein
MAKYLPGVVTADARGTIGSLVFTRGPYGNTIRELAIPINTRTGPQQAVRANLKNLASRWAQVLDDTQRDNWIALAGTPAAEKTDTLHQVYHPTGLNLFLGLNQALKQIHAATIDNAPASLIISDPTSITLAWTAPAGPLTVNASVEPQPHEIPVVFATRALPPGRRNTISLKSQLDYFTAGTAGPWDITADWATKHGAFVLGFTITIGLKYTNDQTGFQSALILAQVFLSP